MNPLDIAILCIVGFCLIRGIFRGLIREVSSIIGVLAGFYAAYTYYPMLTEMISRWFADLELAKMLAFLAIFLGIFILVALLGSLIRMVLSVVFLGWVDRLAGGGFGFVKGVLIVSVVLVALASFLPKENSLLPESRLAPNVLVVSEGLAALVPEDMKKQFYEKAGSLKKVWQEREKKTF
ncbi:membrane protein required for colicin V production [Desulfobotulus alkaliphilus]|uniref:Membrane protein required for colicin V production n=1 Tax=Desulfobotulus alkaliphilus TaxID=622671 RepID=A0A562RS03_9BACT|nr:CvpA family protein [Desulfobotulus alkaliphilus]TWI71673.1 membrane protein required for colicin V production [Desulfobotulus alkaliphilus]